MEYLIATNETDPKIIGKPGYPQCKGVPTGMGLTFKWLEGPNSMTKLSNGRTYCHQIAYLASISGTLTD